MKLPNTWPPPPSPNTTTTQPLVNLNIPRTPLPPFLLLQFLEKNNLDPRMLTFLIIQRYLYSRVRFLLIPLGTASTVYSVHDQWLLLLFLVGDRLIVLNRCLLILKRSWWFVLGWSVWYFSMFFKITCSFCINVIFTLSAAHTRDDRAINFCSQCLLAKLSKETTVE